MKSSIQLLIFLFASFGIYAQNSVLSRSGKEITVNSPASNTAQGQIKLAGDLGGTADLPTVPTLINKVEGSGTLNYIPKFTAGKTLGNSLLFDNGTNVGVGTTSPGNTFEINQGTAGNSGLRFTNLNSTSSATTSSSKVLGLNSTGDVILTNVPGTQNIVDFSTATPTTSGVVFTPNTPADESVVYQSAIDNSLWIYNGTSYVTYTAPASTAWFTAGTTNDAGSSKTSNIYRSGNVGIGTSTAPSALLHLQTSSQAKMLFETTNSASGQASIDLKSALNQHWRIIGQGSLNGGRFEIFNQGGSSSAFNITPSNNVGIGTITPLTLFSNAASGTNFVSSNNSTQGATGISWLTNANGYNTSLYNANNVVGSNGLQVKVANTSSSTIAFEVGQNTTLNGTSVPLFNVLGSGNVGIGTNTPTAQLEVATTNGLSTIIRRASSASQTSANLILQKTNSSNPSVSTAVPSGEYVGRILFSASNGTSSYPGNGTDIVGYAVGNQSSTNNGGGIMFRTVPLNISPTDTPTERMKIDHNGNVGIGFVTPATGIVAPASILDVSSTTSGVLVPRMTTTQRTAITLTTALKGMLVFDSDVNMFYYNVGTSWSPINVGTIKTISAAYTLLPEDNGRVLDVTSATALTITVPNTLPVGFQVSITQAGAGQVTITGGGGMTVNNRYLATRTSGQWAKAGLEVRASGSSVLSGDVQ